MSKKNANISGKQRKEIDKAIKKARPNGNGKIPVTAQQSIPFLQMYKDGICRTDDKHYTKTIQFFDINYQLAQNDDKTAIFENYCDFLNYFDSSINVQLSFLNQIADFEEFGKMIELAKQDDGFNDIRDEYSEMLKDQLAKGNNGLIKTKFITFGIDGKNLKEAKPKLERIETDILNNFKTMGVLAQTLNGAERLAVLHRCFNPDGREKFRFSWDMPVQSGLSVKDFIAPSSFDFSKGNSFKMSGKFGAVSFVQILASEMSDRMLADFLNIEHNVTMSLHLQSIDQNKAIKTVKRKITDLDKMKMEEQKKAFRNGYDIDIMPSDINTFGKEAKSLLNDLQSRNERLFMVTILIMNTADTKRKLDNILFQEQGIAQKYNCQLKRLDYQQEEGIMACVPIGVNEIEIKRGLTTSSTAIFIPFTTQELFQSGEALYYGLNALSNNMILCDRKQLKNPNGLILGTPGSGKSFSAKREIANAFLTTTDDIIICDPEAEYYPLVNRFNGQVIKISPTSSQFINPLDINLNYSEDENPLALKSDFILSLCELIVGGKNGLEPIEKTI
ncbi:MAG: conjugal transfer protein TraE, partial [Clostridia bacterium]|nr:conjugal transfer protein TraE [Clostridia bacterium]